ncbi:sporulation protein YunB [Clostridium sp. KNHs216]|jgi:sporulation protein YunB|uniref:sporulation protein YunB n=1 Tax=Eubacteriales TaxID=186802 RepID=UPI001153CEBE|nr:sporulation protein YunB [Clostridium sp. KNHs216]TQI65562.1 sporulation protein YunB [Clostridium sp. KNHs216]
MRRWHRFGYGNRIHTRIYWKSLIVIIFCLGFIILIDSHFRPIIKSITTNQARIQSIDTINNAVTEELTQNGVTYQDLVSVERDSTGKILAITTQMVKMNQLKSAIIANVQKKIGNNGHMDTGVPLGTLTGNELLHGWGPEVPLRLTLSGNVNADFKSSFESAGINQTKHQIVLNVHTSVYSFLPGFDTTTEVDTNVPVAETIIVGDVPQVVANIN